MRYSDAQLDPLRHAGDPPADRVIAHLAETGEVRAVNEVLRHLIDNDQPVPEELPGPVARWLEATGELPDWTSDERVLAGTKLIENHGPQVALALGTSSLLYCYASWPGVKVLAFSHRLDQDVYRRVGETAQFVLTVNEPGGLHAGGKAIRKIQKVRLLHAAIRHLVAGSKRWDSDAWGTPICQEDLVGTLLSFTYVVVDSLQKLRIPIGEREAEDYLYLWRVVGEMLGIDPAITPMSMAEAAELSELITRRNHRESEEGRRMTAALVEMHANTLPMFDGLGPTMMRQLSGDRIADMLAIPPARWSAVAAINRRFVRALGRAQRGRGPLANAANALGTSMLSRRAYAMAGNRTASFSIPVPPELQRRWTASGVFPAATPTASDG